MDSGFRAITSLFIVKRNDVVLAYPIITPCNLDPWCTPTLFLTTKVKHIQREIAWC